MSDTPRFFITPEKIFHNKFVIEDPQDIKKIRKVLRLKEGAIIQLLNNQGQIFTAEIEKLKQSGITGIIRQTDQIQPKERPHIILAQSLTRAGKLGDIIRMNTEIGVEEFVPFESDYSVFKLDKFKASKLERWQKIAKSAAQQSERRKVPTIHNPISFEEMLKIDADHKLLLHSREIQDSVSLSETKKVIKNSERTLVAIGPEGGFSPEEVKQSQANEFQVIYLDMPILRTETAGIVVSSILLS